MPKLRHRLYDDKFPSWFEDGSGRFLLQQQQGPEEAAMGRRQPCGTCQLRSAAGDGDFERAVLGRDLQPCRICKELVRASQLLQHVRELHLKVHRCSACNAGFVKAAQLERHKTDCERLRNLTEESAVHCCHQRQEAETPYQRSFCDRRFSYKAVFEPHLNKPTDPRPYYCSQCTLHMATREELQWHAENDCDGSRYLPLGPCSYGAPEAPGSAGWTKDVAAAYGGKREGPPC